MTVKINDMVKVVKCSDTGNPIEEKYMGKEGIVREINEDRPAPISVFFDGMGQDGFWPEELEIINKNK